MARTAHCRANHGPDPMRDPGGHCSACRRERKLRERSEHRTLLQRLKAERGCQRCGSRDDLAFRHRAPGSHTYRPARGGNAVVYMVRWGTERLLEEVAKCDLLCGSCAPTAYQQAYPSTRHARGQALTPADPFPTTNRKDNTMTPLPPPSPSPGDSAATAPELARFGVDGANSRRFGGDGYFGIDTLPSSPSARGEVA